MKPGNLSERKRCQIRRQTKDEDSIYAHRVFGVRFFDFGVVLLSLQGAKRRGNSQIQGDCEPVCAPVCDDKGVL